MRIITYNVNGLRSAIEKGILQWIQATNADIYCLQEVKSASQSIDNQIFKSIGYQLFMEPSETLGYSGVAILTKIAPKEVHIGADFPIYQHEGRIICLTFENFSVISIYVPSGSNLDRMEYKMRWLLEFKQWLLNQEQFGLDNLILSGDFNIAHEPIDLHNPYKHNQVGFLPEERKWFSELLRSGFVDGFREVNNLPGKYSWWSYRKGAKQSNLGWRLDYHLVSVKLKDRIKRCVHLNQVNFSDHCPVLLEIDS